MLGRPPARKPVRTGDEAGDRLTSWKEIAAYLGVSVRTAIRWEETEALPVSRHAHASAPTVYAKRSEIDLWLAARKAKTGVARVLKLRTAAWTTTSLILIAGLAYGAFFLSIPAGVIVERSRPFATALPTQMWPAWSPDGKRMALVTKRPGYRQLMIQSLDSSTPRPLTGPDINLQNNRQPFWSRDSQWVYFQAETSGLVNAAQPQGRDPAGVPVSDLYRMPVAGGSPVLVQPGVVRATLSPDGQTLVFLADRGDGRGLNVWFASPPESSPRPYEPRPFPPGAIVNFPQLVFAPDGRSIAAALRMTPSLTTQYRILPWPPGKARTIFGNSSVFTNNQPFFLAWMPDSRRLLVGRAIRLEIVDTKDERVYPIPGPEGSRNSPIFAAVSPDGSRIAYQRSLSHADVVAVPLDGTAIRTVLGTSSQEYMAACSPVADEVVYVTDKRGSKELWIASLAGQWDRPLVTRAQLGPDGVGSAAFSPDGKRVAFVAGTGQMHSVYVTTVDGGFPVLASGRIPLGGAPSWSHDGNWFAYQGLIGGKSRLVKARVGSAEPPLELAESGGVRVPKPEWSPTGEWIAYGDLDHRVALVSPDGARRVRLGSEGPVAWSRDGRTLYQIRAANGALVAIDVPGGRERILRSGLDRPYAPGFPADSVPVSLTGDGKSIVYGVERAREEIWFLEGIRMHRRGAALLGWSRNAP